MTSLTEGRCQQQQCRSLGWDWNSFPFPLGPYLATLLKIKLNTSNATWASNCTLPATTKAQQWKDFDSSQHGGRHSLLTKLTQGSVSSLVPSSTCSPRNKGNSTLASFSREYWKNLPESWCDHSARRQGPWPCWHRAFKVHPLGAGRPPPWCHNICNHPQRASPLQPIATLWQHLGMAQQVHHDSVPQRQEVYSS